MSLGEDQSYTLSGQAGGSSTIGAVWLLPSLRTDSVNRGFCISLFTLEIVVLAVSFRFFLFFIILKILPWIVRRICSE
jgi:hypothetical protein